MNIPNSDDLLMIRRGDVEALKQEAIFGVFRRDAVEFDKLNALLTNAPVVSGEPVAWIINDGYSKQIVINQDDTRTAIRFNWEVTPLFTTPQQPQSVADALGEAAKICDGLAEQDYCVDVRVAAEAIRALIKPNSVKECDDKEYDDDREEIASEHLDDVIAWLKYRGLYDEIDYLNEGPDFSEILTNHEHELIQQSASSQQTQEQGELFRKAVADALEEAAKNILERKQTPLYPNEFDGGLMCHNEGLDVAVQIIRALIKRNTEGVE